jgi:cyclophilin family peptidyl-prolyl cis-trans isomerase
VIVRNATARWVVVIAVVAAFLVGCASSSGASAPSVAAPAPSAATGPTACPTAQPPALPTGETRTVTIATDLGSMSLKIEADLSPIAAGNFVALASCGFYDDVVFHRVVPGFVIQGGDGQYGKMTALQPERVGSGGPGYTIADEPVAAQYGRGVVAMARTAAPNSVGSQFFIVLDDAAREALVSYNTYQIIGHVTAGMETADAIAAAAGGVELPTSPIAMAKVTVANP